MSLVVFHPSVAPFVQQAARAVHEAGELDHFATTVHDAPEQWYQRGAGVMARLAGKDLAGQFRRRAVTELPAAKVRAYPWGELLRLAVGALDRGGRATDLVWEWSERGFDRHVSRQLTPRHTGVYGFEHSSLYTFRRARELGMKSAYDVPAPESAYVHELLARETAMFPELQTAYHRHTAAREARRLERRREELHTADLVIAASRFTRDSYIRAGLDPARARVVPYGAPPPAAAATAAGPRDGKLNLIWAGTFSIRKGAHYVIEAWRRSGLGRHAALRVFGAVTLPDRVLRPLPEGIELRGSIPRAELMPEYGRADALLFPTLCDGFGMVVTEAWSRGVPVITTDRAGAADLLRPKENGLVIPAGSSDAIAEAVVWCHVHRDELAAMRNGALATAAGWQWHDYRRVLAGALGEAGFFARRPLP
jgi:glycosyltransferase involved in cell wall biosynthesis